MSVEEDNKGKGGDKDIVLNFRQEFFKVGLKGFTVAGSDCDEDVWNSISTEGTFDLIEKGRSGNLNSDGDNKHDDNCENVVQHLDDLCRRLMLPFSIRWWEFL